MIDYKSVGHNPIVEEIVDVLCNKTRNTDRSFFRVGTVFFLSKIASCMRASVSTKYMEQLPINNYSVALAPSGSGKGHSVNVMEDEFLKGFKEDFISYTMPAIADNNLQQRANDQAAKNNTDVVDELENLKGEYYRTGVYPFTFDSGTTPAVKQLRHKLLMAGCGSINYQCDEVGSNLLSNTEILNTYLELYDQGKVKQKLIKNTAESIRNIEIDGKTPANMLLFGTPNKLFDGGQTENQFYSLLETGYARRCLFAYGNTRSGSETHLTAHEIYQRLISPANATSIQRLSNLLKSLADVNVYNTEILVPDDVAILLLEYQLQCESNADTMAPHEEIKKAELAHRYFKALKLAGLYAFLDKSVYMQEAHLAQAICLVEESGIAFNRILAREKPYERLAKYIANTKFEVTHADLHEALPFYKQGIAARTEMMDLACAWGYKQHIIIKRLLRDGIEFFKGETLEKSDPTKLMISTSPDLAYNYVDEVAPFEHLEVLAKAPGMNWCNHRFAKGHRNEADAIPGFNTVVFDVDGGTPIEVAKDLLSEYKYFMYTTKRHTDADNRFRILLPINYVLYFEESEYRKFMNNLIDWLPFESDNSANQRCRKWLTNKDALCFSNDGIVLDALQFIPATSKNEHYKASLQNVRSLGHLERWFVTHMEDGNRNNQMIRYAYALIDSGMNALDIRNSVLALNQKLQNPLPENEIKSTILVSVAKRMGVKN